MKHLPPSQREVETKERDLFGSGDIKALAVLLDVDQSYISKQLNENEPEHKSPFYVFIRRLYYADQHKTELGDGYLELTQYFRNGWHGGREPEREITVELVRGVHDSLFDLLHAQINDLPYMKRMQFVDRAMRLLDDYKRDLQLGDVEDSPDELRPS